MKSKIYFISVKPNMHLMLHHILYILAIEFKKIFKILTKPLDTLSILSFEKKGHNTLQHVFLDFEWVYPLHSELSSRKKTFP